MLNPLTNQELLQFLQVLIHQILHHSFMVDQSKYLSTLFSTSNLSKKITWEMILFPNISNQESDLKLRL
jgi:hypothetical protein